jgi:hypothetical protein
LRRSLRRQLQAFLLSEVVIQTIITPVKQKRGNATDIVASFLYKKISGALPLIVFHHISSGWG